MEIVVRLPPAPPEAYLRWVAWWCDVESYLGRARSADPAALAFAPVPGTSIPRIVPEHVRELRLQAERALDERAAEVSPVLRGDPVEWTQGIRFATEVHDYARYVTGAGGAARPYPPDLVPLRERVIEAIETALEASALVSGGASVIRSGEAGSFHVVGEIDMRNAPDLTAFFLSELSAAGRLELDMSEVGFIDSQGLRMLLRLVARALDEGAGPIVVSEPSPPVRRVLELAVPGPFPGLEVRPPISPG
jgi:anti-anti-sigma factor